MTQSDPLISIRSVFDRLRNWYQSSLINRVTVKSQALVGVILLSIGSMTYVLVAEQVRNSVNERLEAVASLNAQRLRSEIDRVVIEFESLSRRSLVANGLADSAESNAYLRPYLYEYRQTFPEIRSLLLVDSFGRVVASADPSPNVDTSSLAQVSSSDRAVVKLELTAGSAALQVGYPVRFEATGQTEGVLVGDVDLLALIQRAIIVRQTVDRLPLVVSIVDPSERVVYRSDQPPDGELLSIRIPIGGVLAEKGLNLALKVSAAKSVAYAPLAGLAAMMLMIGGAAAVIILLLTRKLSENLISPLAEMSHRAMEIAGAGPTGLRELPVTRSDEIGWMGTAFNEMVFSLREAYDSQEGEVRRRTEELAEAREQLAGVLASIDDVVYSIDPGFQRLEYISPAAIKIFGHTPEACIENPSLIYAMIQRDDIARLRQARLEVRHGVAQEVRYRILGADGSIRWVLDRFHQVVNDNGVVVRVSGLVRDVTASVQAEASLHLRERALASSSCGVVISDMLLPGQPILYVNDAFERITGYSAHEVIGRNCSLLQGDCRDGQQGLDDIRSAIAHGRECKVVIRNYRKDGEPFWNELQLSPLHDDSGRITHYIGIQNDISANISATQALIDSEQRLALTIDALHEGVWDWHIPEDNLFTSPSWSGILGLDPFVVAHEPHFSIFARQLPDDWAERVRVEIMAHIASSNNDFYMEHQMLHADGRKIWVANHARIVERAVDGRPLRMVGTIVDISQRVESSQQIIALMSQLDSIFTLSPDAFVYFNEAGSLSFVNPAFERMTGIQSGELFGVSLADFQQQLFERADPAHVFPNYDDSLSGNDQDGQLLHLLKPIRRVLLVSRRRGNDAGSAVVYLRDVTRETEVDRMKSEFLTTAAHELRTPMASIMGFAELLMLREFSPERTKDMLSTMHRQARRLTDLINELLDLARIEARAGKDFKIARYRLEQVVRDAVAALHIDGDRGRMSVNVQDALPEIDIDPAKMQQAVINLLSNAYKYSPNGGAIDISIYRREKAGAAQVGVVVRDHGIGMTSEQTARVFERFFRADPSGNIPGTGLGMSLVKEIMDTHHGSVELESIPGQGTEVSLWLPINSEIREVLPEAREQHGAHGELTLWLNEPVMAEHGRQLH